MNWETEMMIFDLHSTPSYVEIERSGSVELRRVREGRGYKRVLGFHVYNHSTSPERYFSSDILPEEQARRLYRALVDPDRHGYFFDSYGAIHCACAEDHPDASGTGFGPVGPDSRGANLEELGVKSPASGTDWSAAQEAGLPIHDNSDGWTVIGWNDGR